MRRRVAIAWIALASAGALGAACNAILGNEAHELAASGTGGAATAPDALAEAASKDASDADAMASDAVGAVGADDVSSLEEGAVTLDATDEADSHGDSSSAGAVDSPASPQDALDGPSSDVSDAPVDDAAAPPADTTAPSVPTGLGKTNVTSSSITLGWNASTDPDSPVQGYNVYRDGTKVGTPSSTSFTDTDLSANTTYSYTVNAFDPSNNTSAQSTALAVTTAAPGCSFSVPNVSNGVACNCTGNCYDRTWDGCFTIQNTGSFAMTNPVVTFQVPSNITSIAATASTDVPPGFTKAASLNTASSTITISYGGTLAAGASILVYYTDNNQSGPAATNIAVTASNCR